jgi:hypothetical protein
MTEKTFRARVLWVGSGIPDKDLAEKSITIVKIVEQGRDAGFYAHFDHEGQPVSGSVAEISPANWEETGATPTVRVNRSAGG